ncbi:MAG: tripartite tricarboxylate transporter substrate binding protein [Candidatus Parcubacteria bacterium]|nr:tripartite tricarboxylate transporter substrate binding protein [Burkholderiales bacterium]
MKILFVIANLIFAGAAFAQAYPSKPVRIIVPYQAGQGTDVATRHFAEQLTRALGQSFFVENRPGAGANIGTEAAAKSPPDGYTLIMGTVATHTMNQHMYASIGYDPEKDFEPIILTGMLPMVISANPSYPVSSVAELIAAAKAKPDTVNVALPSTTARIVYELLKQRSGAPVFGIAYKGSATSMTEVMGGQVPLTIDTVTATRALVQSGKLKAIAITTLKASELLPGVRSVAEQGLPGFEVTAWNALYAPRGTPKAIVDQLNAEMAKIIATPETRARLLQLGFEPASGSPQQLAEFGRSEREKWGALIKAAGIKAD